MLLDQNKMLRAPGKCNIHFLHFPACANWEFRMGESVLGGGGGVQFAFMKTNEPTNPD